MAGRKRRHRDYEERHPLKYLKDGTVKAAMRQAVIDAAGIGGVDITAWDGSV